MLCPEFALGVPVASHHIFLIASRGTGSPVTVATSKPLLTFLAFAWFFTPISFPETWKVLSSLFLVMSIAPLPRRPRERDQQVDGRDSLLRASILDTALELGVGSSSTVANWIFNPVEDADGDVEVSASSPVAR